MATGTKFQLLLLIHAHCAADLVRDSASTDPEEPSRILSKKCNPVLEAQINHIRRSTRKRHNTTQPSWDDELTLPLLVKDYLQILTIVVWDKHKRYRNYLGELRLALSDLFTQDGRFCLKTDVKWYQLYSNDARQSYVTGSVLLGFELEVKKLKARRLHRDVLKGRGHRKVDSLTERPEALASSVDKLRLEEPNGDSPAASLRVPSPAPSASREPGRPESFYETASLNDEGSIVTLDSSKANALEEWVASLLYSAPSNVKPNEQGFYCDLNQILDDDEASNHARQLMENGSLSEASFTDNESLVPPAPAVVPPKTKKKAKEPAKYELQNRKVYGVLYLEVVLCLDLPRMRNVTRTSYDVDPFVVVTFGRKTYRTSWKRHTLNPIFNERLVFEVLPFEVGYDVRFEVFDKDLISNHDKIGAVSIPLSDVTDRATARPNAAIEASKLEESKLEPEGFPAINALDDTSGPVSENSEPISVDDEEPKTYEGPSTGPSTGPPKQQTITFLDNDNLVHEVRKLKIRRKAKITSAYHDTSNFVTINLKLKLEKAKYEEKHESTLKIRARFETYADLRRHFWHILLNQFKVSDLQSYDYFELVLLLDTLGCTDAELLANSFLVKLNKVDSDELATEDLIDCLEEYTQLPDHDQRIMVFDKCPLCQRTRLMKKEDIDIITHVAVCASKDWSIVNKLLVLLYVTPQIALRKWVPRVIKKISYGKYKVGGNLANILVQDRTTGIILEEKMSVYVRLGIRLLYNAIDRANSRKVRKLLKQLSEKQGRKFDAPASAADIKSFIKFHGLDLSDCEKTDPASYPTFNEFFYRKLKPGARPLELENPGVAVSCADCRCVCFPTVNEATQLWIKGKNFSVAKLFNGNFEGLEATNLYKPDGCLLAVFRLAPQDYHRFHCPVDGTIGPIKFISGEYYTVNPMAVRLELDVFGDNVRAVIPINLPQFGPVVMVAVGAMMVGLIVLTVKEGDKVSRGSEIGYFKFGGSTIVLLVQKDKFLFDLDLLSNSHALMETLVRVGQSVGHAPDVPEVERKRLDFFQQLAVFKMLLIRTITGGDLNSAKELNDWESAQYSLDDDLDHD